jgi:asparagine synthase (glutamine-hydrolysing)
MCGIAGIIALDPDARVSEDRLRRMKTALTHRGPDGSGLLVDGRVGLAHTRLAIIDVARGEQPMCNEDGDIWIVFNGEIYNHAELRPALEARGHRYRTRSDTETILHLYEEMGDAVVEKLQGMFAFAIWDRRKERVLLARDRLGIKPLYYANTGTELLFASEIKSLLASGSIRPEFNQDILPEFLSTRFVSGEETFFRDVRKLLPGHVLTWSADNRLHRRRYWQLPAPAPDGMARAKAAPNDLRDRLEAAVTRHLMSDVPLGVFLSGGIDSSVLAALMARTTTQQIKTFAVGFADREANELPYARMVADHIGAEHHDVTMTPKDFFATLPQALWHEDEPIAFPSSVPLFHVAKLARDHVKVVLTGEGADEIFLGYNRYRVTRWNQRLGRAYWALMPQMLRRHMGRATRRLPARMSRIARRSFVALEPGIRELYLENFAVFPAAIQRRLFRRRELLDQRDPYAAEVQCYEEASGGLLDRICRSDMQTYLVELLMKQDQMSMAASIESRVPFLDDQLVEHVVSIPGDDKLPGWQTKTMLREAAADLVPPEILTRPKMGFPTPVGQWFRNGFRAVAHEFVLGPRAAERGHFDPATLQEMVADHQAARANHGDALWLLVNLEIWQRIFCDGESPSQVMSKCAFSG